MPTVPTVVLTREPGDSRPLRRLLEPRGFRVVESPCIETVLIPPREWRLEGSFRVVLFTSRRGVEGIAPAWRGFSTPAPTIGVVGESTGRSVRAFLGREPDIMASQPNAEAFGRIVSERVPRSHAILEVRGSLSTGALRSILESSGFRVASLVVYENRALSPAPLVLGGDELVLVASPSAAERFLDANPQLPRGLRFVALGPTTAGFLEKKGLHVAAVANRPDAEAILTTILALQGKERDP